MAVPVVATRLCCVATRCTALRHTLHCVATLRCNALHCAATLRCNTLHCVATLRCNTVHLLGMQRIDIPLPVLQAVTNLHDGGRPCTAGRTAQYSRGQPTSYK